MVPCVMNKADEDTQWYFYLTEVDVNVSDQFRTLGQPWKGKGIFQDYFWTWQECWDKCVWNKGISWGGVVVMWLLLWNFFLFRCTLSFQISSYVWLMTWGIRSLIHRLQSRIIMVLAHGGEKMLSSWWWESKTEEPCQRGRPHCHTSTTL